MKITLDHIIELAKHIEEGDPHDWDTLPLSQDSVYRLLGASILERIDDTEEQTQREIIMLASMVHLVVENFLLALKIEQLESKLTK